MGSTGAQAGRLIDELRAQARAVGMSAAETGVYIEEHMEAFELEAERVEAEALMRGEV